MGTTNYGNQIVSIRYKRPVDSHIVNGMISDVIPTGIYKGGYLTQVSGDNWTLSEMVLEIKDPVTGYQVKVETIEEIDLTGAIALPDGSYVVARWNYNAVENEDFMDIAIVTSLQDGDIVIGKRSSSSILYTQRSVPSVHELYLKVIPHPSGGVANVWIRAGYSISSTGTVQQQVEQSLALAGVSRGETCYIYIEDTGVISVTKTVATYRGKPVLASILVPASGDIVEGDITDLRCFVTSPAVPDGSTILRNSTTGKLYVVAASATVSGVAELATVAETIAGTDISRIVTPADLTGKIDTDGTLAGNLDTRIPSQKAVKTYVDNRKYTYNYSASKTSSANTWTEWDLSSVIGSGKSLLWVHISISSAANRRVSLRPQGGSDSEWENTYGAGANSVIDNGIAVVFTTNGKIEHKEYAFTSSYTMKLIAYTHMD